MIDHLTIAQLIERMESSPDFGYDDESAELDRRLAATGKDWRWERDPATDRERVAIVPQATP